MAEEGKQGPDGVNVQVLLRCRPVSDKEVAERVPQVITCNDVLREVTLLQNAGGKQLSKTFRFDKVFGPDSTQEKLFKQAIVPIVQEVMDGFNCTIFAYGQTGTGKTYTMEGGPRDSSDGRRLSAEAGVIPRSIKQIFDTIEGNNSDSTVKVSFLELYNEELTDLLSFENDTKLRLLEDRSGVVVHGLEEVIVRSATEIYQVLDRGTAKRRTAATLLNNRSSRSHSIFTITIHLKESSPDGEDVIKIGKLNLVDLAGSENISRSGAKDARAREAGSINQSLLTLGRVITTLVEHSGHVPYRDSKLTRLLRDSLGGRTKTCIIATIAPTVQCQEETISTLDYAHRAKNIRNKPELNQKISKTTMIKELAAEIEKLRMDLSCSREKNGVYLPLDRYEQGELERVQLRDAVKALKAEMELEETNHTQEVERLKAAHEREIDSVQSELDDVSRHLASTQDQLSEAQIAIQERQFLVQSHQRAEHALAAYAQQLTGGLAGAARDLEVLFAKFEEVLDLQKADRSVLHGLRQYVQSRMDQMGMFVAEAATNQQKQLEAVMADAAALKSRRQEDVTGLRDQVHANEVLGSSLYTSCTSSLSDMATLFQQTVEESRALCAQFSAKATAGLQAAQSAATTTVTSMATAAAQQAEDARALGAKQAAGVQESVEALHGLGTAACSHLSEMSGALVQLQGSITTSQQSNDKALADMAAALEASVQQQQAALLQQISSMVSVFAEQRSREVTNALQEMQKQVAGGMIAINAQTTAMQGAVTSSAGILKEKEAVMAARISAGGEQVVQDMLELQGALGKLSSEGTSVLPGLQSTFQEQCQLVSAYTSGLSKQLEGGVAAVTAAKETAVASASNIAEQLVAGSKGLDRVMQAQHSADVASVNSIQAAASEAASKMQGFSTSCSQGVAETAKCVAHEVTQQLGREVSLNGLPAQRGLQAPSVDAVHELLCPPENIILQQYRREKADILKRAGDVKQASLLLSSPQLRPSSPPAAVTMRQPRSPVTTATSQENQMAVSPGFTDSIPAGVYEHTLGVPTPEKRKLYSLLLMVLTLNLVAGSVINALFQEPKIIPAKENKGKPAAEAAATEQPKARTDANRDEGKKDQ